MKQGVIVVRADVVRLRIFVDQIVDSGSDPRASSVDVDLVAIQGENFVTWISRFHHMDFCNHKQQPYSCRSDR